ncbi:MAG: hypothetical protein JJ953_01565 [Gracilimonas sp.]|uniref:hypothetical protein n=1 Tax=Gracilimonas sp. TaxID=1974203 RepID=UPI001B119B6E|nr:hypothetical protein [Gracilimonas sp.]MBO6584771.1 hypothetical protein [Gracilimonas sp.]MBO6615958.1 hypothetical protein [Gracilimonas sp.]
MGQYSSDTDSIKFYQKLDAFTTVLDIIALLIVSIYGIFTLQDIPKTHIDFIDGNIAWFFDNKLWITLISISVIVLKKAFYRYFLIKKQPSDFRKAIMEELLEDKFDNNRDMRVTLFADIGRIKPYWYYCKGFIYYVYSKIGTAFFNWFGDPNVKFPQKGRYIKVIQRAGWEIKDSDTKFFYTPNTIDNCEGIAARVIQNYESIQITSLPKINDIDLNKINLNDQNDPEAVKVREYMDKSYISDINTLKRLNSRSIHFKADAIYGKTGPVGVLIIDCIKGINPFTDLESDELNPYLNLIGSTYGGNIYE